MHCFLYQKGPKTYSELCTPNSPMQPSTGCEKVKCTVFGTKKGPKRDTQLFFSDTVSIGTTKLFASSGLLTKAMDFKPKSTIQLFPDCQKSPKHLFLEPKCCKFAASKK